MADAPKTETTAAAASDTPAAKKVFCFVSKREIAESEAVEMPYNGQKLWVAKSYIKFKQ